jgi:hypothetical protein
MISTKSTQKLSTEERKKRIQDLYEHQMEKFMQENVSEPLFIPKMAYKPATKDEKHITFFASELERAEYYEVPKNVYTEFISSEYIPEDPKRTLYKWVFNPHWRTEYDVIEATESIQERYMIPVAELRIVQQAAAQKEIKLPSLDLGPTDEPFNMLTIRDLAAIMLKKPVSNKQWLNEIIKSK